MNPHDWGEIKRIFSEVIDLPASNRANHLDELRLSADIRAAVDKLISSDDLAETFDQISIPILPVRTSAPKQIARYNIIREIGNGGMGTVFLAVRDDLPKQVAIKVIKYEFSSQNILRRFENERKILATLEHQNIACLIDGGTTETGLPYFVMEYVEGENLLTYCREKNLSTDERLKIFRKICSAVSYAHSKLIVHRDLKPSNIIVTSDGEPKLLDFGISKLIDDESFEQTGTATALGMMTPNYASPEQFRGETVSTSTDVYSLGVILYELLTGVLPYRLKDKRIDEVARIISDVEAVRPSSVFSQSVRSSTNGGGTSENLQVVTGSFQITKDLRGDLDNIILKSLRKEASERYNSVEQFSEDIRRYLEGLPVLARPATFGYLASKFIQRNQLTVASASFGAVALVGGIAATLWQSIKANQQKNLAEKRFSEVRQLANNVLFKYHDAIENIPGSTEARELLINDATQYLDNLARETYGDTELEEELANAYLKIGDVQGRAFQPNLGNGSTALINYRKSLQLFEKLLAQQPRNTKILKAALLLCENYVLLSVRQADWSTARIVSDKCFEIGKRLINLEPENLDFQLLYIRSYLSAGESGEFEDGFSKQIEIFRKGYDLAEAILNQHPNHQQTIRIYATLGQRIATQTEYWCDSLRDEGISESEILPKLKDACDIHLAVAKQCEIMATLYPNNANVKRSKVATLNNVGSALARLGDGKKSLEYTQNALRGFKELAEIDGKNKEAQRDIADGFQYVAMSYVALKNYQRAVENYSSALKILEPIIQTDTINFEFLEQAHQIINSIGDCLIKLNDFPAAADYYRKGYDLVENLPAMPGTEQSKFLSILSLEKLGDCFVWLVQSLSNERIEIKRSFNRQSLGFYKQAYDKLLSLKKQNQLSQTHLYKIKTLDKKLKQNNR